MLGHIAAFNLASFKNDLIGPSCARARQGAHSCFKSQNSLCQMFWWFAAADVAYPKETLREPMADKDKKNSVGPITFVRQVRAEGY